MSLGHGTKIVRDGLVFYYDMNNDKSWKGAPTTNIIHWQNAVAQPAYTPYVWNTGGTWQEKHPDAIQAFNASGSSITGYVNSGVGDATNKYHGIWTYDDILRKPVVTMRDFDASWKAKSFSTGKTFTQLGLGYGDTYTISWLQWVDNLSKKLRVGVYGRNTSGTNNFHDGLKGVPNTRIGKWERVYATYTVSNVWNLNTSLSIYMYGHYDARATIKIADVQWEVGSIPSKFSPNETRSTTEALLNLTGDSTITPANLTYNSDGSFEFDAVDDYLDLGSDILFKSGGGWAVESWVNYNTVADGYNNTTSPANFIGADSSSHNSWYWSVLSKKLALWNKSPGVWKYGSTIIQPNTWYQVVLVCDSSGTSYQMYLNGVPEGGDHTTYAWNADYASLLVRYIGQGRPSIPRRVDGKISSTKIYNRALTAAEVKQNFEATRGRYGI